MRPPDISIFKQTVAREVGVAQALYDNRAEWPDELAFLKGEILRVLNEQPCACGGRVTSAGWWYCINKNGKRGIAPANRLRMIHRFGNNNFLPQETSSLSSSSAGNNNINNNQFMLGRNERTMPFGGNGDFVSSPTSIFDDGSSFDTESLFDRIFPFSPLERYKNTSLRRMMSNNDDGPLQGVVRNIPIKIERTQNSTCSTFRDYPRNSSEKFSIYERYFGSSPPSSIPFQRRYASAGRISPPAPPERIHVNNNVSLNSTAGPSSSSNEPTSSSDDDRIRPRVIEKTDSVTSRTSNRPTVAPKPKFDAKLDDIGLNSALDKVTWRMDKLGTEVQRANNSLKGTCNNVVTSQPQSLRRLSPELEANAVLLNTQTTNDEAGSSSPSSSGIVADINDSNGESNQRTSATSSLLSCEPATDLSEPGYDTPRPGRTYRPITDGASANHHFPATNVHVTQSPTPQRAQLGHICREPSRLLMPPLEEKVELGSTSVLNNVLAGLAEPVSHINDSSFGKSFNMENQKMASYGPQINRTSSTTSDSLYSTSQFNGGTRFRRQTSTLSEPALSLESNANNVISQEVATQKRIVCDKLTENYRAIDIAVRKIGECTAARAWRQPHILQRHLDDIQENVETIVKALKEFLDAGCRIAVDPSNPKAEDLKRLLSTLQSSSAAMAVLKQSLDNTGWTLGALSRQRNIYGTTQSTDSLDQFLAITKQLPTDCHKLIQWALTLVPTTTVRFLAAGLKDTANYNNISSSIYHPENGSLSRPISSEAENAKRQSSISTASSMTISSLNELQIPSSLQATKGVIPSSESSSSSEKPNRVTFTDKVNSTQRLSSLIAEGQVLEEDDLESVVSDRDSFYQDYAMTGDNTGLVRRKRPTTSLPPASQLSAEAMNALSEDDRQLIRFYSPQLDAHTQILSQAIDEFLVVVEEQLPPHEFVQKGKLIILAAHKLIYIGDNIAQCITAGEVSSEVRQTADRLCNVLKTCVQATKQAADEYSTVSAVQSMVDSIVTVSHAAQDLKLLVNSAAV